MVLCAWICLGALIFLLRSTPGVAAMLCLPSALLAYMYTPQLFRLVRCPRCHGRLGELAYVAIMVSTHQVFVAAKQTLATDCSGSMTPIRSQRQFERRRHRRRQTPARPPSASRPYTSVCSAISKASSTSTPEVPHRAFQLRVAKQQLHCAQVLGSPVDQGGLGATH